MNQIQQDRYYKKQSLGTDFNPKLTGTAHDEYLNKLNLIQQLEQTQKIGWPKKKLGNTLPNIDKEKLKLSE